MADPYVLLVEGPEDSHVFYHLMRHYRSESLCIIKPKEGIDNLLSTLDVELLASGLERIGIVVDADTDLTARWQAIRNILISSGYTTVPLVPESNGTIIEENGRPMVGIWIMPNNTLPGMLEDFLAFLVPIDDTLWERARDCVEQIPEQDQLFPQGQKIKAHVHTWLAWQEEPGKPLGQAITKHYLDPDAPQAHQLITWIGRLFNLQIASQ